MKSVIFDMDGVLIDSEAMYQYLLIDFFHQHGQKITLQQCNIFVGCSDAFFYQKLGELWNPTKSEKEMRDLYHAYFGEEQLDYGTLLNPHVKYILPQMKQKGIQLAIASSSSKKDILKMAERNEILIYFDQIVSGHEVPFSKPDPAIYLEVVHRLGAEKKECVVIEDSSIGIQAAKQAGLYVIAKREVRFQMDQSQADFIADDLLQAWLHIQERFLY